MPKEITVSNSDLDIGDFPPFSPKPPQPETPLIEIDMDASDHCDQCPCTFNAFSQAMAGSPATCKRDRYTSDLEDQGGLHEDEPAAVRFCSQRRDAANMKARAKARAIVHSGLAQHPRPIKPTLSIHPLLPGVTAGNLPIPPSGSASKTIRFYLMCPVLRRLDWRTPHAPTPATADSKPWVGDTADLEAAFVQTRGLVAKRPCAGCSAGRGLWKSCVERLGKKNNGICANCWQAGEFCTNFNKAPSLSGMAATLRPCNKTMPNEQLIPFAMGDEMLDNLIHLRRTEQELLGHLDRIQARITELEEKQRREAETTAKEEDGEFLGIDTERNGLVLGYHRAYTSGCR
ncbi:hypothetical protein BDW72DRAFT_193852 [Aspergillus terricola var. indicus]